MEDDRDLFRPLVGIGPRHIYYCFIVNDPMTLECREAEGQEIITCPLCKMEWEESRVEREKAGGHYISTDFFVQHAWRCSMNGVGMTVADDHRALKILHGDASVTTIREYSKPPWER